MIIAGDRDMLIEVLIQIYNSEIGKTSSVKQKKEKNTENGVDLDALDEEKTIIEAESCVEFLILSFCHNFYLKPKQGAGLLAQGCKYLAIIIAKGLKGDFEPVKLWLQEIYSSTDKLSNLVFEEKSSGSVAFVLSALKPGMLSKDFEVVQWTLSLFNRLVLDLTEKDLLSEV